MIWELKKIVNVKRIENLRLREIERSWENESGVKKNEVLGGIYRIIERSDFTNRKN